MYAIDEKLKRRQLDPEALVRRNVLDERERSSPQFTRRKNLRCDRRDDVRTGEYGHLNENTSSALRVNEHDVVVGLEDGQQIAQSQASVRGVQEQGIQLPMIGIRDDDIQLENHRM